MHGPELMNDFAGGAASVFVLARDFQYPFPGIHAIIKAGEAGRIRNCSGGLVRP